jgi:hypothetical protein
MHTLAPGQAGPPKQLCRRQNPLRQTKGVGQVSPLQEMRAQIWLAAHRKPSGQSSSRAQEREQDPYSLQEVPEGQWSEVPQAQIPPGAEVSQWRLSQFGQSS